jgi:hypothetical protein
MLLPGASTAGVTNTSRLLVEVDCAVSRLAFPRRTCLLAIIHVPRAGGVWLNSVADIIVDEAC